MQRRMCKYAKNMIGLSGFSWKQDAIFILLWWTQKNSDVHLLNAMRFGPQGMCAKTLKSWSRTFQQSLVPASLPREMSTFLWGTQCVRCHAEELCKRTLTGSFTACSIPMYTLTCTVYFVTPADTLLKDTSRLICLFSRLTLVLLLIGSGRLNDLDSECQIHQTRRWLLNQKTPASVQQLSCQPSECDCWGAWRRFHCPWGGWDSWEFDSQYFQQSSWSKKWRRF